MNQKVALISLLTFVIPCALICLRSGLEIDRLGPDILKAHVMELFSSMQGSLAEKGC